MATFGSFCLLIALALAAYNLLAGAAALRLLATGQPVAISPERLADTARRAGIAGFVAISCAAFALIWSVFTNDFSITYILEHSNRALPIPYKFAALWSGQEGSLLLWAWLLGTYGFVLRLRHKTDVKLYAYASAILAGVQVFFLLILNFAAPPFALLKGAVPDDGNGLNPLLQYPEMVIHPPMLYLGYVGFSVPFAFALGALMMRYPGEKWIKVTRIWTMVTWLFLTCGIFLGMHWAYAVLRMGRLLGLGSGRECKFHALAYRDCLFALSNDAGTQRHDEKLERVADLLHVSAYAAWHAAHTSGIGELSTRIYNNRPLARGSSSSWGLCWPSASSLPTFCTAI